MGRVESGTRLANMRWCRRHIFVANAADKEGLHWFLCAFDCRVRLELFTIWVWEPLSSTHLIRPFLLALKKLSLTTKHRALGFQMDGWSCGFQSLNIAKLVEHQGSFSDVPLVPMGAGFVDYVLSIVNADRAVRVVQAPGDDVEGVTELPCPLEFPASTQVEGALSAMEESVQAIPTPLEGKEASTEQSVESPEATPWSHGDRWAPLACFVGCIFFRLFGAPTAERIRLLLYWPHTSALVAYNGGTSVGHGPVRTLFLEPDFVPNTGNVGTLDVGHGPIGTLFLSLILCLVPMTPCETMFYWPHTSALVAYNGGTSVGHGPVRTLFLEPDFVSSAGTLDVGHGPVRTLFLGLIFSLLPMSACETMLYWPSPKLIGGHAQY